MWGSGRRGSVPRLGLILIPKHLIGSVNSGQEDPGANGPRRLISCCCPLTLIVIRDFSTPSPSTRRLLLHLINNYHWNSTHLRCRSALCLSRKQPACTDHVWLDKIVFYDRKGLQVALKISINSLSKVTLTQFSSPLSRNCLPQKPVRPGAPSERMRKHETSPSNTWFICYRQILLCCL